MGPKISIDLLLACRGSRIWDQSIPTGFFKIKVSPKYRSGKEKVLKQAKSRVKLQFGQFKSHLKLGQVLHIQVNPKYGSGQVKVPKISTEVG